jgi:hypothetical protein
MLRMKSGPERDVVGDGVLLPQKLMKCTALGGGREALNEQSGGARKAIWQLKVKFVSSKRFTFCEPLANLPTGTARPVLVPLASTLYTGTQGH